MGNKSPSRVPGSKSLTEEHRPADPTSGPATPARSATTGEAPGKRRVALITGITGQDGSYLAELLLGKGYRVHGVIRRSSTFNTGRIDHLYSDRHTDDPALSLHYGDLADASGLRSLLERANPDEVYNLGAQSHVRVSFHQAEYTADIVATGTLRLLEAVRDLRQRSGKELRFYQAGSSEMFGSAPPPQSESTPFHPRSPYAVAKLGAYWHAVNAREAYGLYVANGMLFNHESPRRGETFVTRKITRAAGRIREGIQQKLYLGNLDARRDWGYAADYAEAMWRMLQQPEPDDYVVATGESHSVRDFLRLSFETVGLDYREFVEIDPAYYRPSEVDHLCGDASKAKQRLGWEPTLSFSELVRMMSLHDWELAARERALSALAPDARQLPAPPVSESHQGLQDLVSLREALTAAESGSGAASSRPLDSIKARVRSGVKMGGLANKEDTR